jgi:hypothetical protein
MDTGPASIAVNQLLGKREKDSHVAGSAISDVAKQARQRHAAGRAQLQDTPAAQSEKVCHAFIRLR